MISPDDISKIVSAAVNKALLEHGIAIGVPVGPSGPAAIRQQQLIAPATVIARFESAERTAKEVAEEVLEGLSAPEKKTMVTTPQFATISVDNSEQFQRDVEDNITKVHQSYNKTFSTAEKKAFSTNKAMLAKMDNGKQSLIRSAIATLAPSELATTTEADKINTVLRAQGTAQLFAHIYAALFVQPAHPKLGPEAFDNIPEFSMSDQDTQLLRAQLKNWWALYGQKMFVKEDAQAYAMAVRTKLRCYAADLTRKESDLLIPSRGYFTADDYLAMVDDIHLQQRAAATVSRTVAVNVVTSVPPASLQPSPAATPRSTGMPIYQDPAKYYAAAPPMACYSCGLPGHFARECPEARRGGKMRLATDPRSG